MPKRKSKTADGPRAMVRIDNDLAKKIRAIALGLDITAAKYVSDVIRPHVERDHPRVLDAMKSATK